MPPVGPVPLQVGHAGRADGVSSEDYRLLSAGSALPVRFRVRVEQTDLLIAAHRDLTSRTLEAVHALRGQIQAYGRIRPDFISSLIPLNDDEQAPPIVRDMLAAGIQGGVGPMAAVAGAVARRVGHSLLPHTPEVMVENGGDIFMRCDSPQIFCILAESSPIGMVRISVQEAWKGSGMGVCTSSGRLGHSLSFGDADAVTVVAEDACLADSLATALANRVRTADDINRALREGLEMGALGAVIIADGKLGAAGKITFVE